MKQAIFAPTSIWWRWPLISLLVTVVFLAHDVAMAGDAHAGSTAASHHSRSQAHIHLASHSPASGSVEFSAAEHSDPCLFFSCVPPTDCDVGQTMARPAAGDGGGLDPSPPIRIVDLLPEHPPIRVVAWAGDGPTMPPEVRRALLQVFLI